jgi:hypothetical protein
MEETPFLNLDIVFQSGYHGDVDRYSVRAHNSLDDGINYAQPFDNPLTEQERSALSIDSARPINLTPQRVGLRLFEALFHGEMRDLLVRSREQAKAMAGLRLRLHLNDTPALALLPWEYLYDPIQSRFLALTARLSIVRYLDLGETPPPAQLRHLFGPASTCCFASHGRRFLPDEKSSGYQY